MKTFSGSLASIVLAAISKASPVQPLACQLPLFSSNDFVNLVGPCKPFIFIFARGTGEPGNMGITVGPALQTRLTSIMPDQFMYQGVAYDADIPGDIQLGVPGGKIATALIDDIAEKCPNTKQIVSGYSEGAMVAHDGVGGAKAESKAKVAGVLVYGDPFDGKPIEGYPESQVKTFCADGDLVCDELFIITPAHLSYVGEDTDEGAAWIQQVVSSQA